MAHSRHSGLKGAENPLSAEWSTNWTSELLLKRKRRPLFLAVDGLMGQGKKLGLGPLGVGIPEALSRAVSGLGWLAMWISL